MSGFEQCISDTFEILGCSGQKELLGHFREGLNLQNQESDLLSNFVTLIITESAATLYIFYGTTKLAFSKIIFSGSVADISLIFVSLES